MHKHIVHLLEVPVILPATLLYLLSKRRQTGILNYKFVFLHDFFENVLAIPDLRQLLLHVVIEYFSRLTSAMD